MIRAMRKKNDLLGETVQSKHRDSASSTAVVAVAARDQLVSAKLGIKTGIIEQSLVQANQMWQ